MNKAIKTEKDIEMFVEKYYSDYMHNAGEGDPFWDNTMHETLHCLGSYAKENGGDMELVKDMVYKLCSDEASAFKLLEGNRGFNVLNIAPERTRKHIYVHLQCVFA